MHVFLPFSNPWTLYYQSLWMGCRLPLAFFWNDAIQAYLRSQKKPGKTHNVKFFSFPEEEMEFHSFVPAVPPTPAPPPHPQRTELCTRTTDQVRSCIHTLRERKKLIRFPGLARFLSVQLHGLPPPHIFIWRNKAISDHILPMVKEVEPQAGRMRKRQKWTDSW